jgi:ketosteroid isomerase-like protein
VIDFAAQQGIELLRAVTSLPRLPEHFDAQQRGELVLEEASLLDLVKSFAHTLNAGDIDSVVARYAKDATWLSPRGRFAGTDEIRRNYELYYHPIRWFTLWTNVTVRFVQPFDEAYVSAYQYSIGVNDADPLSRAGISTDVWRMERGAGRDSVWRIAERRIDMVDSHGHRLLPAAVG